MIIWFLLFTWPNVGIYLPVFDKIVVVDLKYPIVIISIAVPVTIVSPSPVAMNEKLLV